MKLSLRPVYIWAYENRINLSIYRYHLRRFSEGLVDDIETGICGNLHGNGLDCSIEFVHRLAGNVLPFQKLDASKGRPSICMGRANYWEDGYRAEFCKLIAWGFKYGYVSVELPFHFREVTTFRELRESAEFKERARLCIQGLRARNNL